MAKRKVLISFKTYWCAVESYIKDPVNFLKSDALKGVLMNIDFIKDDAEEELVLSTGKKLVPVKNKDEIINLIMLGAKYKKDKHGLPVITSLNRNISKYSFDQEVALNAIADYIHNKNSTSDVFTLAGFAGTGKTTLIENISLYLQAKGIKCAVLTLTNKACAVVKSKIPWISASTIHKALYTPRGDAEFNIGSPRKLSDIAKFIIFDEASMIPQDILTDLLGAARSYLPLVFIGDPFQLPPVKEETTAIFNNVSCSLTTVLRHDSNILGLATAVRKDQIIYKPRKGKYNDITPCTSKEDIDLFLQLYNKYKGDAAYICFTNRTRVRTNQIVRYKLKRKGVVEPKETLISISNNRHYANGDIVRIKEVRSIEGPVQDRLLRKKDLITYFKIGAITEAGLVDIFLLTDTTLPSVYNFMIPELVSRGDFGTVVNDKVIVATYGYALSCHKAQGSQWKGVVVHMDYIPKNNSQIMNVRWYYTAITRAQRALVVNTDNF